MECAKNLIEFLKMLIPHIESDQQRSEIHLWDGWKVVIEETDSVPHLDEVPDNLLNGDFFHKASKIAHNLGETLIVSFKQGVTKKIYLAPQNAQ